MNKRRAVEIFKSIIIVLLVISAGGLIYVSGYYSLLWSSGEDAGAAAPGADGGAVPSLAQSVRPIAAVVSQSDGTHHACAFDAGGVAELYSGFAASLGEAIGSSGAPESIDFAEFRSGISRQCVLLDFYWTWPLSLVASRLGVDAAGASGYSARYAALCCRSGAVELLFSDGESYFRCTTGVSEGSLSSKLAAYRASNCVFAFEDDRFSGAAPLTPVLDSLPEISSASLSQTQEFDLETVFSLLDMNSYAIHPYSETDGTLVYVGSGKTLRVSPGGGVTFRSEPGTGPTELIEAANAAEGFVRSCLGTIAGAAELYLAGVREEASGGFTVYFEYCVNGIPVRLSGGEHAAEIYVCGGTIAGAELLPRTFEAGQTQSGLLPPVQACAIAASVGGEPRIVYDETASGLVCRWVRG